MATLTAAIRWTEWGERAACGAWRGLAFRVAKGGNVNVARGRGSGRGLWEKQWVAGVGVIGCVRDRGIHVQHAAGAEGGGPEKSQGENKEKKGANKKGQPGFDPVLFSVKVGFFGSLAMCAGHALPYVADFQVNQTSDPNAVESKSS